jgi:hypothetical protein
LLNVGERLAAHRNERVKQVVDRLTVIVREHGIPIKDRERL